MENHSMIVEQLAVRAKKIAGKRPVTLDDAARVVSCPRLAFCPATVLSRLSIPEKLRDAVAAEARMPRQPGGGCKAPTPEVVEKVRAWLERYDELRKATTARAALAVVEHVCWLPTRTTATPAEVFAAADHVAIPYRRPPVARATLPRGLAGRLIGIGGRRIRLLVPKGHRVVVGPALVTATGPRAGDVVAAFARRANVIEQKRIARDRRLLADRKRRPLAAPLLEPHELLRLARARKRDRDRRFGTSSSKKCRAKRARRSDRKLAANRRALPDWALC